MKLPARPPKVQKKTPPLPSMRTPSSQPGRKTTPTSAAATPPTPREERLTLREIKQRVQAEKARKARALTEDEISDLLNRSDDEQEPEVPSQSGTEILVEADVVAAGKNLIHYPSQLNNAKKFSKLTPLSKEIQFVDFV